MDKMAISPLLLIMPPSLQIWAITSFARRVVDKIRVCGLSRSLPNSINDREIGLNYEAE